MPIDPYLAGFPEGRDGFCDHCHLHRRYCSIGSRAPPLVGINESSQDTDNADVRNVTVENGTEAQLAGQSNQLPNGHVSPVLSNGTVHATSPPAAFRSYPGEVNDDHIVSLYGDLSASANRVVRRRGLLQSSPATTGSPIASARYVSRRVG